VAHPKASRADGTQIPIIAVASGKGGVGKSTVAVNLALALRANGHAVGLVDADLYGPDVPRMLGLRRKRGASSVTLFAARGQMGSRLEVVERYGIQLASAGVLLGESQGLGIQADIAQLLVHRLIADAAWADVDCLLVDLPPGTADIQQFVFGFGSRPVYVLVVVTPQVIAHQDVRRLIADLPRHRAVSVQFSAQAARDADQGLPVMVTGAVPEQVAAYRSLARELDQRIGGLDPTQYARERE
jgi:ATP-binding protein involved in chromosome partitioning